jgi:hypothetical protein
MPHDTPQAAISAVLRLQMECGARTRPAEELRAALQGLLDTALCGESVDPVMLLGDVSALASYLQPRAQDTDPVPPAWLTFLRQRSCSAALAAGQAAAERDGNSAGASALQVGVLGCSTGTPPPAPPARAVSGVVKPYPSSCTARRSSRSLPSWTAPRPCEPCCA